MSANIKHIAKHCAVSTSTVSLALRRDPRVSPELTARINAAAVQLGYQSNGAARRLVMKRYSDQPTSRLVVLGLPSAFYKTHFFSEMLVGMLEVLEDQGYGVVTMTRLADDLFHWGQSGSRLILIQHDIEGIILFSSAVGPEQISRLREEREFSSLPLIGLAGNGIAECPSVYADYHQGAYLAARHLLALGHRHILYFFYEQAETQSQARLAGMRRAIAECSADAETGLYGMQFNPEWINPRPFYQASTELQLAQHPEEREAREKFRQFLREHPAITAICALNDAVALHIWHTLREAGLRVPEDYSLIGFDDTDPYFDVHGQNLLTSVRLPLVEIGKRAAELLIRHARETQLPAQHYALPVELVVRHSTGPTN